MHRGWVAPLVALIMMGSDQPLLEVPILHWDGRGYRSASLVTLFNRSINWLFEVAVHFWLLLGEFLDKGCVLRDSRRDFEHAEQCEPQLMHLLR